MSNHQSWGQMVPLLSLADIDHTQRGSPFQAVMGDPNLPLFFHIKEAPTAVYINLSKLLAIIQRIITSDDEGGHKILSLWVNPADNTLERGL